MGKIGGTWGAPAETGALFVASRRRAALFVAPVAAAAPAAHLNEGPPRPAAFIADPSAPERVGGAEAR